MKTEVTTDERLFRCKKILLLVFSIVVAVGVFTLPTMNYYFAYGIWEWHWFWE